MSLDLINTASTLVSALAVVASLVFVALQLKANTKAQRASSAWQAENAWAQLNFEVARDPQIAVILDHILSSVTGSAPPEGPGARQTKFMIRSLLQHVQSQFFLFREGSLSEESWRHQRSWAVKFVKFPIVEAFLSEEIEQDILSADFRSEVLGSLESH